MSEKPKLTQMQIIFMALGCSLVFPYTFMPILLSPPTNQDVWLSLVLSNVYLVILNLPILLIASKFKGLKITDTMEIVFGKVAGKCVAVLYALFTICYFVISMAIIAMFMNLYLIPETPTWAMYIFMAVAAAYTSYKGAGTLGRLSTIIVPFIISTIIFFFILGVKDMNFDELRPVLADSSFFDINLGAFITAARYSEILIFFVFPYFLEKNTNIFKLYSKTILTFFVCYMAMLIPTITLLGAEVAKDSWNPYFQFSRQVKGYDFLERMQSINTVAWMPTSLLKLSLCNFTGCHFMSNALNMKSHRPLVIPFAAVGTIICFLPVVNKSIYVDLMRSDRFLPYLMISLTFFIPLILLIVYIIRRKKVQSIIDEKINDKEETSCV